MKMKLTNSLLLGGMTLLFVGGMILSSCEGPAGPAGADGADGTDGIDGVDGQDGQDANATCTLCHSDDQVIVAKSRQYANSGHSTGDASGYTNRSMGALYNCAGCHTSQGFLDALIGESNVPYADVTQPNCYTCHNIHDTYTDDDWALTKPDATDPASGSTAVDLGSGNQCTMCHQVVGQYLAIDSLWANFDDGGVTTVTTNAGLKRAGAHHGPQYNMFAGMDLFEFAGTETYPTNAHPQNQAADGCVTCHMDDAFGDLTGHSMAITYEFHGSENFHWPASCLECHVTDGALDLDDLYTTVTTATDALLVQLYDLLVAANVIYPEGVSDEYLLQAGVFTTEQMAAAWNYNTVREDLSLGFHNPAYIQAVLANSIEALNTAPTK